jgi:phosphate-selective porin OprO/OprP
VVAALSALGTPVFAQSTPTQTQTDKPLPPVGWNDGFFIQTPDGHNRLLFGVLLQADGRFSLNDPTPAINSLVMRRARPTFVGRVARYFEFRLMPELAGTPLLLDAYFDVRFAPSFRLRSGKDKTPIGYEVLLSDSNLPFPERSVVSLLLPSRDVGFQAQGDFAAGRVLYSGGVFNGNPTDGSSSTTDVDVNNAKDLAGRIVFLPFANEKDSRLSNFGFHLGGSTGTQGGALPSFRTSIGQTFFTYAPGATASGPRRRITPAVFLYTGHVGVFAEYARTSAEIARNSVAEAGANHAWNVTASYMLTGEVATERTVRPTRPFDPAAGQWGALQLTARYGELRFDEKIFELGLAAPDASTYARQFTVGMNWLLNAYVKAYGTYERYTFGGGRPAEDSIYFRMQLAF